SAYGILTVFEAIPPREGQPKAGAEARRALELDETLPTAHVQLGFYQLNYLWDFAGALKSFERAVDLHPSSSAALHGLATALVVHGRFDEALARMKRATEVDPLWLLASADLCTFLYFERRYDAAIAQCRKTLEMEPDFPPALYYLTEIYETLGRDDDVYRSYRKLLPLMGVSSENMARNEAAYAAGGWKAVAKRWLEVQLAERKKRPLPAFSIAESYRRLGEREAALDWLEKACDERHFEVVFLKVSPKFDSLRSHPRFERLLKRMGLAT
ncbi:MAG TPA: tetratricopeptide repeat protein, partial [Thermoanaerobaculia bacterium]|nr:tetratricopeptide repeat protein [Thermoanaerobaculia bacterium]